MNSTDIFLSTLSPFYMLSKLDSKENYTETTTTTSTAGVIVGLVFIIVMLGLWIWSIIQIVKWYKKGRITQGMLILGLVFSFFFWPIGWLLCLIVSRGVPEGTYKTPGQVKSKPPYQKPPPPAYQPPPPK